MKPKPSLKSAAEHFALNCHGLHDKTDQQSKILYNLSLGLHDLTLALDARLSELESRVGQSQRE